MADATGIGAIATAAASVFKTTIDFVGPLLAIPGKNLDRLLANDQKTIAYDESLDAAAIAAGAAARQQQTIIIIALFLAVLLFMFLILR
jgi:hypothetical protein